MDTVYQINRMLSPLTKDDPELRSQVDRLIEKGAEEDVLRWMRQTIISQWRSNPTSLIDIQSYLASADEAVSAEILPFKRAVGQGIEEVAETKSSVSANSTGSKSKPSRGNVFKKKVGKSVEEKKNARPKVKAKPPRKGVPSKARNPKRKSVATSTKHSEFNLPPILAPLMTAWRKCCGTVLTAWGDRSGIPGYKSKKVQPVPADPDLDQELDTEAYEPDVPEWEEKGIDAGSADYVNVVDSAAEPEAFVEYDQSMFEAEAEAAGESVRSPGHPNTFDQKTEPARIAVDASMQANTSPQAAVEDAFPFFTEESDPVLSDNRDYILALLEEQSEENEEASPSLVDDADSSPANIIRDEYTDNKDEAPTPVVPLEVDPFKVEEEELCLTELPSLQLGADEYNETEAEKLYKDDSLVVEDLLSDSESAESLADSADAQQKEGSVTLSPHVMKALASIKAQYTSPKTPE